MNSDDAERASTSEECGSAKTTKSEVLPSRGKERWKCGKKKKARSATNSASSNKRRLGGGADAEAAEEQQLNNHDEYKSPRDSSPEGRCDMALESHSNQKSFHREPLPPTGDSRVDEMLECALQNLDEAGKALASLGENLEHELKLFLVELMGRTRKWMSQVEGKIEWTRRDIGELHKELSIRISAVEEMRNEAAELKTQLNAAEVAASNAAAAYNNKPPQTSSSESQQKKGMVEMSAQDLMSQKTGAGPGGAGGPCAGKSLVSCCSKSQSVLRGDDPASARAEEERLRNCCEELECELQELRKENERIVKERAEYESAIQRALLKGVSSLNVEALKVLRCTPIPNCCPPCPPTTTMDCSGPSGGSKRDSGKNGNGGSRDGLNGGATRKMCPNNGQSERKSRKSKDNNMLLLLHQKDAENFGIQTNSNYCENASKKANICSGGNCGGGKGNGRSSAC